MVKLPHRPHREEMSLPSTSPCSPLTRDYWGRETLYSITRKRGLPTSSSSVSTDASRPQSLRSREALSPSKDFLTVLREMCSTVANCRGLLLYWKKGRKKRDRIKGCCSEKREPQQRIIRYSVKRHPLSQLSQTKTCRPGGSFAASNGLVCIARSMIPIGWRSVFSATSRKSFVTVGEDGPRAGIRSVLGSR